jgi:hypothetical protein
VAVKVTAVGVDTVSAVTLNAVEVPPAEIVTVDGTLAAAEDELRVIVAPGPGAGAVRATLQIDAPGGVTETGLHEKPFRPGVWMIVTVPLLLDAGSAAATESDAATFENWTADDVFLVELDNVKDMLATTPFEIVVVFMPHKTQFEIPGMSLLQETDLFAVIAIGPAPTPMEEKSTGE